LNIGNIAGQDRDSEARSIRHVTSTTSYHGPTNLPVLINDYITATGCTHSRYGEQPTHTNASSLLTIRVEMINGIRKRILIPMPRPWLPGPPRQRLPREPYPCPGVIEPVAELIKAQVLVPLFAQERVMVVRVRPVSLGRKDPAIGIIPVVVGALALRLSKITIISLTPGTD